MSGKAVLYLFSFSGVASILINQFYFNNLRRELIVWDWAFVHALSQSLIVMSSSGSSLQASNFFIEDSGDSATRRFHSLETMPLPKQSPVISFSICDRVGMNSVWSCCVLIKFLPCKYLKKWLKPMISLSYISSKDLRCFVMGLYRSPIFCIPFSAHDLNPPSDLPGRRVGCVPRLD